MARGKRKGQGHEGLWRSGQGDCACCKSTLQGSVGIWGGLYRVIWALGMWLIWAAESRVEIEKQMAPSRICAPTFCTGCNLPRPERQLPKELIVITGSGCGQGLRDMGKNPPIQEGRPLTYPSKLMVGPLGHRLHSGFQMRSWIHPHPWGRIRPCQAQETQTRIRTQQQQIRLVRIQRHYVSLQLSSPSTRFFIERQAAIIKCRSVR